MNDHYKNFPTQIKEDYVSDENPILYPCLNTEELNIFAKFFPFSSYLINNFCNNPVRLLVFISY